MKEMKEKLSQLSDDERSEKLLEIYRETKKDIIKNEGEKKFDSEALIILISKEIGDGYEDYLDMSVSLLLEKYKIE